MSTEPDIHAVTPVEVAQNPLVSGLNSPLLGQTLLKVLITVLSIAASLLGFKAASPGLASILPEQVYQVAGVISAVGAAVAAASPGLRQKVDPKVTEAVKAAEKAPPLTEAEAPKFL